MNAQVIGLAQQAISLADDLLLAGVGHLGHNLLDRAALPPAGIGMPLSRQQRHQRLDLGLLQPVGFGRLPDRRLGSQGAQGRDQGDLLGAVGAADILQYFMPPAAAKIQINVRGVRAGRIQKSLKQEIVRNGINCGDAGAVGH